VTGGKWGRGENEFRLHNAGLSGILNEEWKKYQVNDKDEHHVSADFSIR
jgi:hypothetical protein